MISKKQIQVLKSLKDKNARDENNIFVAETPKIVSEFIAFEVKPVSIFVLNESMHKWKNQYPKVLFTEVSKNELDRLSYLKQSHEVVGVFEKFQLPDFQQDKLTLLLDRIADPGNMGTLIRTADWFGVKNVICSEDSVDIYNPKVVQSSMGSLARVNVYYKNIDDIRQMLHPDSRILGADMQGTDIKKAVPAQYDVILIGSEAHGIQQFEPLCTEMLAIPMKNKYGPESLNAAVAGAIMLYHFAHAK